MAVKKLLDGKTYAVTGAAGFIGSTLADRLLRLGARVVGVDNMSTGRESNFIHNVKITKKYNAVMTGGVALVPPRMGKKIPYVMIFKDASDESIAADFKKFKVDCVFHLAANAGVPSSFEDPIATNQSNAVATLNVLNAAHLAGVKRVVFASSSSVYGGTDGSAVLESDQLSPKSPYALQKKISEDYCKFYSDVYNLDTVCLRYFNVFGPRQDLRSKYSALIPSFCNIALGDSLGKKATIYGDGSQYRDFCFIDNVVDANILAARREEDFLGESYNIACGETFTVNDVAKIVGLKSVRYTSPRTGDIYGSKANIEKAKKELGYNPKISFEKGINITMRWYLNNPLQNRIG